MRRWRDRAWPTCTKTRCRSTSPKDVSCGSSAIGARRFRAITSTFQAADKPCQGSLCWSRRCVTVVQGADVHSCHLAERLGARPLCADGVAKVFLGDERNFSEPLMRFTSGDVRDHIVSSKIDQGPP